MTSRVAIIGAGSSGLAVAKQLKHRGIAFECFEKEDQLGGNWCYGKPASGVYQSTHTISSKPLTEYREYPMPEEYPQYPHHTQVLAYLRSYADHFHLTEHIRFSSPVQLAQRDADGGWRLTLEDGKRHFSHLVIANGHNWDPRTPDLEGRFAGQILHSADYKTPDVVAGRRVLVVGGGNSGCDIAAECSRHASQTRLSLRRGYHILPKFFHGLPIDLCGERGLRWRMPLWLRRRYARMVQFLVFGDLHSLGFPRPDHRLFECHPIINSQLVDAVRHGDLQIAPGVAGLTHAGVTFVDDTTYDCDVIIFATGYKLAFPFIDRTELNWQNGRPQLYLNVFHPQYDDLFVAGLIQPDSGQFGLVEMQARCIAEYLDGLREGRSSAEEFRRRKAGPSPAVHGGVRYLDTPRHAVEVEHYSYSRQLERLHKQLRRDRLAG